MSITVYQKEFPSTTAAVAETLTEALDALTNRGWCKSDSTFSIRLCLEEALVNAVVHGNQNEPARTVRIHICEDGERCRICVHDEGEGFDPETVKMADCSELGGRGVCLIKEFMDHVHFDGPNKCLEMVFNRKTFCEACT